MSEDKIPASKAAQARAEHRLAIYYFVAAALAAVGLICTSVVFGYWHFTLDECEGHPGQDERHCGCLLFARSSYRYFIGGDTPVCHFVQYSCVPGVVVGLLMGVFHWYRASFVVRRPPRRPRRRIANVNDQDVMLRRTGQANLVSHKEAPSTSALLWWLGAAFLAGCLALLTLASAVTLTTGALQACAQYRANLIETLAADGYLAALLTERISCQAVFDFMDFLQPIKERHSANFINTGVALHFAIFAMWFAAVAFVATTFASVFEAMRARQCCCAN